MRGAARAALAACTPLLVPHLLPRAGAPPIAAVRTLRASAEGAPAPGVDAAKLAAVLARFSPSRAQLAARYVEALVAYNARTNVYSQGAYDKLPFHLHDSLTLGERIAREPGPVLDMGSGSGLPSVCVAICNPSVHVWAVESKGRKTAFLRAVASDLGLRNLHVLTENLVELTRASAFDVRYVTAKAFKPLPEVLPLAQKAIAARARLLVPISEAQVLEHGGGASGGRRVLDPVADLERVGEFIYFSRLVEASRPQGKGMGEPGKGRSIVSDPTEL